MFPARRLVAIFSGLLRRETGFRGELAAASACPDGLEGTDVMGEA